MQAITADTVIAYITHDDRPDMSSASSRSARRGGTWRFVLTRILSARPVYGHKLPVGLRVANVNAQASWTWKIVNLKEDIQPAVVLTQATRAEFMRPLENNSELLQTDPRDALFLAHKWTLATNNIDVCRSICRDNFFPGLSPQLGAKFSIAKYHNLCRYPNFPIIHALDVRLVARGICAKNQLDPCRNFHGTPTFDGRTNRQALVHWHSVARVKNGQNRTTVLRAP